MDITHFWWTSETPIPLVEDIICSGWLMHVTCREKVLKIGKLIDPH